MQLAADKALTSRCWYWLAALAILFYSNQVIQLADNTPKFDDLNDVFGFFKALATATTWQEKLLAFTYPNNEHITVVDHIVYYLQYQLIGEIRFYPLILLGHLVIILSGILLGLGINSSRRPFYFFVITLAYINLQCWDSSFKAMTALSNQLVILFAIASVQVLAGGMPSTGKLLVGIALAILATFSQGNGMLVWPTCLLLLLTDNRWQANRSRDTAIWLFFAFTTSACYFLARHYWQEHPSSAALLALKEPLQIASFDVLWQTLLQHPLLPLQTTAAFLGATLFSESQSTAAILAGCSVCLLFLRQLRIGQPSTLIAIHFIALFLLLSAMTAGFTRGLAYGTAESVVNSRYKMYSMAFVMLVLAGHVETCYGQTSNRQWLRVVVAAMLAFALTAQITAYPLTKPIREQAQKFQQSYDNWIIDGDFRKQLIYFPPMSDHLLFVADHLQLLDFTQLTPTRPWLTLSPAPDTVCKNTHSANACKITATHRGNAIAVLLETTLDTGQPQADVIFCATDSQSSAPAVLQTALPTTSSGTQQWLVTQQQLPAGAYRVILQAGNTAACETSLSKKTRRVDHEMQQLFGKTLRAN
ncbi:MAG TPA: hypothetical protein PLF22_03525 [Pseudomonadales bacterium]|nr:hypothetical protein [Pseudomonadales bacterium]